MGEIPSSKKIESSEETLIKLLKERGPQDPEARALLLQWDSIQEAETREMEDPLGRITLNLRRARLYFKSGYTEEARESFDTAREQAWLDQPGNEGLGNIRRQIIDEMESLGLDPYQS